MTLKLGKYSVDMYKFKDLENSLFDVRYNLNYKYPITKLGKYTGRGLQGSSLNIVLCRIHFHIDIFKEITYTKETHRELRKARSREI